MESIKDKETGSIEIHLSNEEVIKLIKALDDNKSEIVKEFIDKLWNN